jgi:prevent-host-death family protein
MKTVSVRDLQKKVRECVDDAQKDRVIITKRGKPAAVLIGVGDKEWESVILQSDPGFWKLIRNRRKQSTLSLEEMRGRLHVNEQRR